MKNGPKVPSLPPLTEGDEALVVAFRRHMLLPLACPREGGGLPLRVAGIDPALTRSALHRCLQRHGISRLPDIEGDKPKRQCFKRYPIRFFHVDIAEVQTAESKLYLFVGIDCYPPSSRSHSSSTRLIDGQRGSSLNTCGKPCLIASISS